MTNSTEQFINHYSQDLPHTVAECYTQRLYKLSLAEKHINRYQEVTDLVDLEAHMSLSIVHLIAALDGLKAPDYGEDIERMKSEGILSQLDALKQSRLLICHLLERRINVLTYDEVLPEWMPWPHMPWRITTPLIYRGAKGMGKAVNPHHRVRSEVQEELARIVQALITLFLELFESRLQQNDLTDRCDNSH